MPVGTNTPAADFEFEIKAISVDGAPDNGTNMPQISSKTISYTSAKNGTTTGNVKSIPLESPDIFNGVTFPHAGSYVYEITEIKETNPDIDSNTDHDDLAYSNGKYTLTVLVKNKTAPATGTYIHAIAAVITTQDNNDQTVGDKVDPTPKDPETSGIYSKMIFTNTYVKTNGPDDPEDPDPTKPSDSTLNVSKKVTGASGNLELYFNYTMEITVPSLVTEPKAYKAYVVDANGTIVSAADLETLNKAVVAGADKNDHSYIEFNNKQAVTFSLKHGQKLVFIDTPVGTSYEVKETKAAGYVPNVSVVYNGGLPNATNGGTTEATSNTVENIDHGVTAKLVGEAANSADFINDRKEVSITGLDFSDLPFIGMIVLAIGAVAAIVVSKIRKAKKNYN